MMLGELGPREDYQLVGIRIFASTDGGQTYPVELDVAGWRSFPSGALQLDHTRLLQLAADPKAYGRALGEMLFADTAIGSAYRETMVALEARGDTMRLRLRLDPAELETLGWERILMPLGGDWQPLAATADTPFSRYVLAQRWERPKPITERPVRVLAVLASPDGLEAYNLDPIPTEERQALHTLLDGLPEVNVTYLESGTAAAPSLNAIRAALSEGHHLIHILCHGARTARGNVLYMEAGDGATEPVEATRLVEAFKLAARPPALTFLAACESAMRSRGNAFVPLGPALVERGGVQAVIAMSDRVGLQTARLFTGQFYTRLLNHGLADLAMNEARALVQDEWDWGVPVLFSRLPDNQLIDFPIGRFYDTYLSHADRAYLAVDEALAAARRQEYGGVLVDNLERLVKELSKSHEVLVDVASRFRRVGSDPDTFAQRFDDFYYEFKDYYDRQAWIKEETSCREIRELGYQILPKVRPLLNDDIFEQLQQELSLLGDADGVLLRHFREYLETMNETVEAIYTAATGGDIPEAIRLKRNFEAQISPSFRRSKEMFERMNSSVTAVMAA